MGIYENNPEWKQIRNWEILKNRHAPYIYTRITETVTDDDNRNELLKYVRRFGNPARKIIRFLSSVHARPVCRTTDKDDLHRTFWKHVDARSLNKANQNAEYFANGMGDSFVYIYKEKKKKDPKIKFKLYAAHQVKVKWDDSGEIETATFPTAGGIVTLNYHDETIKIGDAAPAAMVYNPLIHYRKDDTAPGWGVDIVEPIFDTTIEIGNQICLFLESGYLRSHEQLALDVGANGDINPGDIGDVKLGSRTITPFPLKAVPLVSADTAEKFFESIENLARFAAEQEGIPAAFFSQENVTHYPPDLKNQWEIDAAKWRDKDLECLLEAGRLLQDSKVDWDPETKWLVIYQEPRGMISRKEQLETLDQEISLGLSNPAWFAFANDGDFETYQDAKDWIMSNVEFMGEFREASAARNLSLTDGAPIDGLTPRENGAVGGVRSAQVRAGAMDADYDGNAGPAMIPRKSFPK